MRYSARRGALSIGRSPGKTDRSLETVWDINPGRYEGIRNVDYSGMTDLVDVLERKISDNGIGGNGEQRGG